MVLKMDDEIKPFGSEKIDIEILAALNQALVPLDKSSTRSYCHKCCFENIDYCMSPSWGYFLNENDSWGNSTCPKILSDYSADTIDFQLQRLVKHPLRQVKRFCMEVECRFERYEKRYQQLWGKEKFEEIKNMFFDWTKYRYRSLNRIHKEICKDIQG